MAQGHKTGGRQKGTKNRKTVLLEEKGREALAEVLGANAFEGDAHSLLIAVYKDEAHPIELRLEAAKAAIRFEKPALAALDARGTIENVHYAVGEPPH
jgi:DNA-binding PadR family transcriptional regulator